MIGVFGGTFDPPHIGHYILAAEAKYQLDLDRVIWVLTGMPPHKPVSPVTPATIRWEMLKAAVQSMPGYELSRIDLDRPGPHYAVDTLRLLANEHPDQGLVYLMGSDSLRDLPTWHAPQDFVHECGLLAVMPRPEVQVDLHALEQVIPGLGEVVRFLQAPYVALSASDIRDRVGAGAPIDHLVSPGVSRLLQEHGLYR